MKEKPENHDLDFGDIGDFNLPDLSIELFTLDDNTADDETRYMKPRLQRHRADFVRYDNAVKLARSLRLDKGERTDAIVSGNFIFGDFIEAYLVEHNAHCRRMIITTLSLSQNNVDSLAGLIEDGYIDRLDLIVSVYFWANERHSLIPYIYDKLDRNGRFQLAVAAIHTKTAQFETAGGRKIVLHGSANLRSSDNIEQITIEENAELYDFYADIFDTILERYATIRRPIRGKALWADISKHKFND